MKKVTVCLCAYLLMMAAFIPKLVSADEKASLSEEVKMDNYVSRLYKQIDFHDGEVLPFDVFSTAMHGYMNLRNAGKLNAEHNVLTVCDMAMSSTTNRMWVIDLDKKKVLFNNYVAHGQGSGDDGRLSFSNKAITHKSSLGFYVTKETYDGEHGTSLRLDGQDEGFNDAALDRGIVVHGAEYVCDRMIAEKDRIGRSWGCPAVPQKLSLPIIESIKEGTCLFIYYPDQKYLGHSYWLNKKVAYIPEQSLFDDVAQPTASAQGKMRQITYMTNNRVDSVKMVPVALSQK